MFRPKNRYGNRRTISAESRFCATYSQPIAHVQKACIQRVMGIRNGQQTAPSMFPTKPSTPETFALIFGMDSMPNTLQCIRIDDRPSPD